MCLFRLAAPVEGPEQVCVSGVSPGVCDLGSVRGVGYMTEHTPGLGSLALPRPHMHSQASARPHSSLPVRAILRVPRWVSRPQVFITRICSDDVARTTSAYCRLPTQNCH